MDSMTALFRNSLFAGFAILLVAGKSVAAVSTRGALSEYDVKAGFIYNFAKLVEWPPVQGGRPPEISLCIFRYNVFGESVNAIADRKVNERTLTVRLVNIPDELKNCNIVFIPAAQVREWGGILDDLRGRPILTIGDTPGLAERGVIINFYPEKDAVRFEINVDALKRSHLSISSRLLNLSRIVHENGVSP